MSDLKPVQLPNQPNQYSETPFSTAATPQEKVLKNTYALLAMTLAFSALTAGMSMALSLPLLNPFISLIVSLGLLFAVHKTCNSSLGILMTFAFTGFMGMSIGPILNIYTAIPNGSELVMYALGGTAFIFFSLSAFTLITKKDFSFMGKTLFVGILVAFIASIANYFLNIPALSLTLSSVFIILSSGIILYQTSEIIHGGEKNYIRATVTLYVSIYNIFTSLLHLLTMLSGDE